MLSIDFEPYELLHSMQKTQFKTEVFTWFALSLAFGNEIWDVLQMIG